jgi:hypothetical protein
MKNILYLKKCKCVLFEGLSSNKPCIYIYTSQRYRMQSPTKGVDRAEMGNC